MRGQRPNTRWREGRRPRAPLSLSSTNIESTHAFGTSLLLPVTTRKQSRKMLHGVVDYFQGRHAALKKTAGYIGGAYLLGHYVLERLEDVKTTVMQDRFARDKSVAQL